MPIKWHTGQVLLIMAVKVITLRAPDKAYAVKGCPVFDLLPLPDMSLAIRMPSLLFLSVLQAMATINKKFLIYVLPLITLAHHLHAGLGYGNFTDHNQRPYYSFRME